jgi:hypothetical protein
MVEFSVNLRAGVRVFRKWAFPLLRLLGLLRGLWWRSDVGVFGSLWCILGASCGRACTSFERDRRLQPGVVLGFDFNTDVPTVCGSQHEEEWGRLPVSWV